MTCSTVQSDSKPASSAIWPRDAAPSGVAAKPVLAKTMPNFTCLSRVVLRVAQECAEHALEDLTRLVLVQSLVVAQRLPHLPAGGGVERLEEVGRRALELEAERPLELGSRHGEDAVSRDDGVLAEGFLGKGGSTDGGDRFVDAHALLDELGEAFIERAGGRERTDERADAFE